MWIKLLHPHAVFYPPRVEAAGSMLSVGGPRAAQLIAAGIAEPAAQPPEPDDDPHAESVTHCRIDQENPRVMTAGPQSNAPGSPYTKPDFAQSADCTRLTESLSSAAASALVAALGRRRARRKIARKF